MRKTSLVGRAVVCLESLGYRHVNCLPVKQGVRFYRPTEHREVYGVVCLHFLSPRTDDLVTWCGVSVTRIIHYKGLTDYHACMDLGTDVERGIALLDSAEKREEWHSRLGDAVNSLCQKIVNEKGQQLLQATDSSRQLARSQLAGFDAFEDWQEAAANLAKQFRDQTDAVERLVTTPGIVQLLNSLDLYRIAAYLVLSSNFGYADAFNAQTLSFHETSWPVQLVVDRLVASRIEAGCKLDFQEK